MELRAMSAVFTMAEISKYNPRNLILTSGTLKPFERIQTELGLRFNITYTCDHVIDKKKQLKVICVKSLDSGQPLTLTYQNRSNTTLINQIGSFLTKIFNVTPKGVIIFFPSYSMMALYVKTWKSSGIWTNLDQTKPVCIEDKSKKKFAQERAKFEKNFSSRKGAAFLCVCNGKLSEGIDFSDDKARLVINIGVPFGNQTDPRVQGKKQYLEELKRNTRGDKLGPSRLGPSQWYFQEALRAVNQNIGRIIRHKLDYGAVLLLDDRYSKLEYKNGLSDWVSNSLEVFERAGNILNPLKIFFSGSEEFVRGASARMRQEKALKAKELQKKKLEVDQIMQREIQRKKSENQIVSKKKFDFYEGNHFKKKKSSFTKNLEKFEFQKKRIENFNPARRSYIPLNRSKREIKKIMTNSIGEKNVIIAGDKKEKAEILEIKPDKKLGIKELIEKERKQQKAFEAQIMKKEPEKEENEETLSFIKNLEEKLNSEGKVLIQGAGAALECMVCYSEGNQAEDFKAAKCGHLACGKCWQMSLKNVLECPMCKERVREKHLLEVKFV